MTSYSYLKKPGKVFVPGLISVPLQIQLDKIQLDEEAKNFSKKFNVLRLSEPQFEVGFNDGINGIIGMLSMYIKFELLDPPEDIDDYKKDLLYYSKIVQTFYDIHNPEYKDGEYLFKVKTIS